jgi:enoyl-CoA hydratase/carnithine racemase
MTDGNSTTEPHVLKEMSGQVLWLTLNRPQQRNPLSSQMIAALSEAIETANHDPGVRAIVITSSGPVFSAGHDLREMGPQPGENNAERERRVRQILQNCAQMMLQSTATAAGCQLVSACDLAIASDEAKFCTPARLPATKQSSAHRALISACSAPRP